MTIQVTSKNRLSDLTLEEAFSDTLTNTPCVYLNKHRESWVATEMCVQYLESIVDSLVIRDDEKNPVGIVGGYDVLDNIRKNPTRDFQYEHTVEEIMNKNILQVEKTTTIKNLIEKWKETRRAFAIIPNEYGFSPISARKMLEIGMQCKTNITASSLPKKKIITFQSDETLSKIIDMMFENNTRKLLLEYSNQFISDRLILNEISKTLKFQPNIENLLDIPVNQIEFEEVTTIKEDLNLSRLCSMMYKMEHPYVIYKDNAISPWDICTILLSESLSSQGATYLKETICPHCGKNIY